MKKSAERSSLLWLDTRKKYFYWKHRKPTSSLLFLWKSRGSWAVSQSSDYGGAQWRAEVVEIGAQRILWPLWIQDRHVCFCFSSGCRPKCDNSRRECQPQTTEGFAHNLTTQVSLKDEFVGIILYLRLQEEKLIFTYILCTETFTEKDYLKTKSTNKISLCLKMFLMIVSPKISEYRQFRTTGTIS